jgi:hypothetical protein
VTRPDNNIYDWRRRDARKIPSQGSEVKRWTCATIAELKKKAAACEEQAKQAAEPEATDCGAKQERNCSCLVVLKAQSWSSLVAKRLALWETVGMAKNIKVDDSVMLNGSVYVVIEIDKDKKIANLQSPKRDATVYAVPWSEISKLDDQPATPIRIV